MWGRARAHGPPSSSSSSHITAELSVVESGQGGFYPLCALLSPPAFLLVRIAPRLTLSLTLSLSHSLSLSLSLAPVSPALLKLGHNRDGSPKEMHRRKVVSQHLHAAAVLSHTRYRSLYLHMCPFTHSQELSLVVCSSMGKQLNKFRVESPFPFPSLCAL